MQAAAIFVDGAERADGRDASYISFAIEEDFEDRLGVVAARWGGNVVKICCMRDDKWPEFLWNVAGQHHCFGGSTKNSDAVFGRSDRVVLVFGAHDVIGVVGLEVRCEFFV